MDRKYKIEELIAFDSLIEVEEEIVEKATETKTSTNSVILYIFSIDNKKIYVTKKYVHVDRYNRPGIIYTDDGTFFKYCPEPFVIHFAIQNKIEKISLTFVYKIQKPFTYDEAVFTISSIQSTLSHFSDKERKRILKNIGSWKITLPSVKKEEYDSWYGTKTERWEPVSSVPDVTSIKKRLIREETNKLTAQKEPIRSWLLEILPSTKETEQDNIISFPVLENTPNNDDDGSYSIYDRYNIKPLQAEILPRAAKIELPDINTILQNQEKSTDEDISKIAELNETEQDAISVWKRFTYIKKDPKRNERRKRLWNSDAQEQKTDEEEQIVPVPKEKFRIGKFVNVTVDREQQAFECQCSLYDEEYKNNSIRRYFLCLLEARKEMFFFYPDLEAEELMVSLPIATEIDGTKKKDTTHQFHNEDEEGCLPDLDLIIHYSQAMSKKVALKQTQIIDSKLAKLWKLAESQEFIWIYDPEVEEENNVERKKKE